MELGPLLTGHETLDAGGHGHAGEEHFVHGLGDGQLDLEGAGEDAGAASGFDAFGDVFHISGQLVSEIAAWDNGTPLGSDQPTWAHALNSAGYETALCGKMHFIGPDQMHGFQRRLLTDVHGSGNARLIANWESLDTSRAAMDRSAFDESGPGDYVYQQYDDEVAIRSAAYLAEPERRDQPWALCASFITPHNPLIVRRQYWDRYFPEHADQPGIPAHKDSLHPHNLRMGDWFDFHDLDPEKTARARAGYYGLVTFCDERIGQVLDALDAGGQAENTLVVYVSDHGELNGEHGLWNKQSFYEHSSHIPMIVRWPGHIAAGRRIDQITSLIDLSATILDVAGANLPELTGTNLLPLLRGDAPEAPGSAISEYFAVSAAAPARMLRRGSHKLNYYHNEPLELFDLDSDPNELTNLANDNEHTEIQQLLRDELLTNWNPDDLDRRIRASQRDRLLIAAGDSGHGTSAWKPDAD